MMTSELDAALEGAVRSGAVAGVAAASATDGGIVHEHATGVRELGKAVPMTMDTVFWLASMTKAVTAAGAMQLVERKKLQLDVPAREVLPQLNNTQVLQGFSLRGQPILRTPRSSITLRNLLAHTSGFSYVFLSADLKRFKEITGQPDVLSGKKAMLDAPLVADPGTRWEYGIGLDWVGQMMEAVTGQSLGEYLQQELLDPLGMSDTSFVPPASMLDRLACMHVRAPDGTLVTHPLQARTPEFHGGGGDLFSTVRDYLRFLRMLLGGGELDGVRVLRPETVKTMSQNHIGTLMVRPTHSVMPPLWNTDTIGLGLLPDIPCKYGLSFLINTEATPQGRSAGSLAWAGLTNTYFWIDPVRRVAGVLMTQTLPFLDEGAAGAFRDYEAAVYRTMSS